MNQAGTLLAFVVLCSCKPAASQASKPAAAPLTSVSSTATGSGDALPQSTAASSPSSVTGTGSDSAAEPNAGGGAEPSDGGTAPSGSGTAAPSGSGAAAPSSGVTVPSDSGVITEASQSGVPPSIGTDAVLANTSPTTVRLNLQSERLTNTGYRQWTHKGSLGYVQGLQIYASSYWNATLATSVAAHNSAHPVGSIAVMEAYADAAATQFKGWYVLGKASTATDPSAWFTYEVMGDAAPQVDDMGDASCSSCHSTPAYPTYIIGSPY